MEDASLDEFLSGGDDAEVGDSADTGSDADVSERADAGGDDSTESPGSDDGTETPTHDVEPAQTTARWAADGVVCAGCGERVSRCWQSPDGLVCPDCKEW